MIKTNTCHEMHSMKENNNWEQSLQEHFPSYYLSHLSKYKQVCTSCISYILVNILQKNNVSWDDEYKKAYQSMSLRYMDGANLQQSKVFHFGPTLGISPSLLFLSLLFTFLPSSCFSYLLLFFLRFPSFANIKYNKR